MSPEGTIVPGELSQLMTWVQNEYNKWILFRSIMIFQNSNAFFLIIIQLTCLMSSTIQQTHTRSAKTNLNVFLSRFKFKEMLKHMYLMKWTFYNAILKNHWKSSKFYDIILMPWKPMFRWKFWKVCYFADIFILTEKVMFSCDFEMNWTLFLTILK